MRLVSNSDANSMTLNIDWASLMKWPNKCRPNATAKLENAFFRGGVATCTQKVKGINWFNDIRMDQVHVLRSCIASRCWPPGFQYHRNDGRIDMSSHGWRVGRWFRVGSSTRTRFKKEFIENFEVSEL